MNNDKVDMQRLFESAHALRQKIDEWASIWASVHHIPGADWSIGEMTSSRIELCFENYPCGCCGPDVWTAYVSPEDLEGSVEDITSRIEAKQIEAKIAAEKKTAARIQQHTIKQEEQERKTLAALQAKYSEEK